MPVLDALSGEYSDQVTFVGVAGRSDLGATTARAAELMPSGNILWGLDGEMGIWEAYGVRSQPVTVLITSRGEIIDAVFFLADENAIRAKIERLIDLG